MALADRLASPPPRHHGGNCTVCAVLIEMDEQTAAGFQAAMLLRYGNTWAWPESELEAELADTSDGSPGYTVGSGAIGKHRRGQCKGERRPT